MIRILNIYYSFLQRIPGKVVPMESFVTERGVVACYKITLHLYCHFQNWKPDSLLFEFPSLVAGEDRMNDVRE